MLPEKLKQIDQQLIDLLGKRIAVLAESQFISLEEQITNFAFSLVQAGVPESMWKNLVTGCTSAANTFSPANTKPRRVTLVGGRGMMGHFFQQKLSAAGHYISILDQGDWEQAESLLKKADLVLVCVPIEYTIDAIHKLAKYLSPTTALADIASIKTPILQTMLEQHSGPVMSLHPMFGPGIKSFLCQKVVVCSGRGDDAFQWLLDLIEHDGGKLIVSTPKEHDEMMIAVQAIRNFTTFSLGVFLAEQNIDIRRSLDFSSPIFRLEMDIVGRLFSQSAPLVVDIMLATSERREAIGQLAIAYNRLAQLVIQNDRDSLIQEFKATHSFLAEDMHSAVEESTHLIDTLSTLLAAKDVEQKQLCFVSKQNAMPSLREASLSETLTRSPTAGVAIANQPIAPRVEIISHGRTSESKG
ncbi:MAG: bifunctional chorismate mutase/prephenate dehydrogenase [Nostoc sp. DedVER02]|uniref:bifunctional chorismate mutase/prephenate dehydrogenase n=1 Tax=unclassified Nostoc TaxID=2593658 RepID=UPI002AD41728|nr:MULTISPECIES: bifunctional chorismate mutase/prephenate dehydrogenase [unclassified Nostoc]MDZ7990268.1 bifunctional chorismate mutase/prephenate dehydrogenase [Nostoc sp. DedVER02]MDZ8114826.1 bifunctional chorismate mutase/prephenate dehydrogenase [Nostoc sp. DedVER01b]